LFNRLSVNPGILVKVWILFCTARARWTSLCHVAYVPQTPYTRPRTA